MALTVLKNPTDVIKLKIDILSLSLSLSLFLSLFGGLKYNDYQ